MLWKEGNDRIIKQLITDNNNNDNNNNDNDDDDDNDTLFVILRPKAEESLANARIANVLDIASR
jgi:hypothetical protein